MYVIRRGASSICCLIRLLALLVQYDNFICTAKPPITIINKVLIKVTLNKVIAGALYIVICG